MNKNLESRLLYLPVSILGRVELWLTYRGLKPASSITLRKDLAPRILSWLDDADLFYAQEEKENSILHVSKEKHKVDVLHKTFTKNDPESIKKKGELYGYPEKSVNAYSQKKPIQGVPLDKKVDWTLYARYVVTDPDEESEIESAKNWSNCIKSELPRLHKWYKASILNSI